MEKTNKYIDVIKQDVQSHSLDTFVVVVSVVVLNRSILYNAF